jgi:PAS domain-containing protein
MNLEDLYRLMRTEHVQAQGIVDTIGDPLLVLDGELCVQTANRAFYNIFKVSRDETIGQHLYELGNGQWNIADLRRLLEDVIPRSAAVLDYEVEHDFPGAWPAHDAAVCAPPVPSRQHQPEPAALNGGCH